MLVAVQATATIAQLQSAHETLQLEKAHRERDLQSTIHSLRAAQERLGKDDATGTV